MVTDYCQFVDLTLAEAGGQFSALPSFLLGHSMGGLLTLNIARARAQVWRGAVVSAPALKADPDQVPPALIKLNLIVSAILPKITTVPLDVSTLCHDEAVVAAYHNDPLVCHAPMKARLGAELGSAMEATLGAAKSFTLPFLLMHGTADKMCLPAGSQEFYDTAASSDKKLVMLDGACWLFACVVLCCCYACCCCVCVSVFVLLVFLSSLGHHHGHVYTTET